MLHFFLTLLRVVCPFLTIFPSFSTQMIYRLEEKKILSYKKIVIFFYFSTQPSSHCFGTEYGKLTMKCLFRCGFHCYLKYNGGNGKEKENETRENQLFKRVKINECNWFNGCFVCHF